MRWPDLISLQRISYKRVTTKIVTSVHTSFDLLRCYFTLLVIVLPVTTFPKSYHLAEWRTYDYIRRSEVLPPCPPSWEVRTTRSFWTVKRLAQYRDPRTLGNLVQKLLTWRILSLTPVDISGKVDILHYLNFGSSNHLLSKSPGRHPSCDRDGINITTNGEVFLLTLEVPCVAVTVLSKVRVRREESLS